MIVDCVACAGRGCHLNNVFSLDMIVKTSDTSERKLVACYTRSCIDIDIICIHNMHSYAAYAAYIR